MEQESRIGVLLPDGKHIRPVVTRLLQDRGLEWQLVQNGRLHGDVTNYPASLTVQNHRDVTGLVARGIFDAGFVGSDVLAEYTAAGISASSLTELARFDLFSKTLRLSLLVRDNKEDNERYQEPTDLRGARIVTTYPALISEYLGQFFPGEQLPIVVDGEISGKEEGQVDARVAEGAGVTVESGGTMVTNNLRELKVIMYGIQVVLISNLNSMQDEGTRVLLEEFRETLIRKQVPQIYPPQLPGFISQVPNVTAVPLAS